MSLKISNNSKQAMIMAMCVLLFSSLALACHPSCTCLPNSHVCQSCIDPNSSIDVQVRSCPCNEGYFTSQLSPFQCTRSMAVDDQNNDISIIMNACNIEIAEKVDKIIVDTNCYFSNINDLSYVLSEASLDLSSISLSDTCKEIIRTKIQYQQDGEYIDIPAIYVIEGQNGAKSANFPLIDLFDIAVTTTFDNDQITQIVPLAIHIGHPDKFVRRHRWDLIVYTNRQQVNVFTVDVDVQETQGCQEGQECIVVADLTTEQLVCSDATCTAPRANNEYNLGDLFIAKIYFTDPSYTKQLQFVSLYVKTDDNKVYDETSLTTTVWQDNALIVTLPLTVVSDNLVIQVKMLIAASRLRVLDNASDVASTKIQLTAHVSQANNLTSNTDNSSATSASILAFAVTLFVALLI